MTLLSAILPSWCRGKMVLLLFQLTTGPVFFAPELKKIPGIKKLHHFRCVSLEPGVVYVKEHADTAERKFTLWKSATTWSPYPYTLPPIVPPKGLSAERQWYLFDTIREFCHTVTRTLLALYQPLYAPLVHLPKRLQPRVKMMLSHPPNTDVVSAGKDTTVVHALIKRHNSITLFAPPPPPPPPTHTLNLFPFMFLHFLHFVVLVCWTPNNTSTQKKESTCMYVCTYTVCIKL